MESSDELESSNEILIENNSEMESPSRNVEDCNPSESPKPSGKTLKKHKHGIIYISTIPRHMNVTILREMLSKYADVGRIFLQPDTKHVPGEGKPNPKKKKRRFGKHFTEGWVEFLSKGAAKQIALELNSKPMATRKSSKFYDVLWSMKYLPRFKWVHLSERLTYEKAVHKQKLQTEISQARREANFFQSNLDQSEVLKKTKRKSEKKIKSKSKEFHK